MAKAPKLSLRSLWAGAREAQEDVLRGRDNGTWTKYDADLWTETIRERDLGI